MAGSKPSGVCASCPRSTATSRRSTAAAAARFPVLSTAIRTRASPATGSRSSRSAPGRDLRGAPRRGRRHPLDSSSHACRRRGRAPRGARQPPRLDAGRGHDDLRGEVRLRPRSRHRAGAAARDSRRRRQSPPGSARTQCRPSSTPRMRTSTSRWPRFFRRPRESPRRPTSSSSAAPSTPTRHAVTSRLARAAGLALRLHGDQFTESGAIPLAIELGARSVDHLEATGPDGIAALAASDVTGVLLPASALFLDRPMPPARALVDAGAAVALATDFNPGSAFCESLPLVCVARVHAASICRRPRR